jgi:RNA polymerase sigma factor (sigma-70 family)
MLSTQLSNDIKTYQKDADRLLTYFGNKYKKASWLIHGNDELLGLIIEALVIADDKWQVDRGASKKSFRYNSVKFCVLNYIKQQVSFYKKFSQLNNEETISQTTVDNSEVVEYVHNILQICPLTKQERSFICRYYLDNRTLKEIGEEFGCSLQNVQQTIGRGLQLLKDSFRHSR